MELARTSVAGLAVATMIVGTALAGCGEDSKSVPSSSPAASSSSGAPSSGSSTATSSSAAQPTDYTALLIKASDVGPDFTTPRPPAVNPGGQIGVAQLFASPDGSRRLGDTILILDDPAKAATVIDNTKGNYAGKVSGTWQPADVGSNGTIISGTVPDHSLAVTVLLFSEGKAVVNMEFDSRPNDSVTSPYATAVGGKQDAAIKSGLPS